MPVILFARREKKRDKEKEERKGEGKKGRKEGERGIKTDQDLCSTLYSLYRAPSRPGAPFTLKTPVLYAGLPSAEAALPRRAELPVPGRRPRGWGRPPVDFRSPGGSNQPAAPRPGAATPLPHRLPCAPAAFSPREPRPATSARGARRSPSLGLQSAPPPPGGAGIAPHGASALFALHL